jgi:hypothetical protein
MTATGLLGVTLVVDALTGLSGPVAATGAVAGVVGIVYLWDLNKRGWRIFEPRN